MFGALFGNGRLNLRLSPEDEAAFGGVHVSVSGESFSNDNGRPRWKIIRKLRPGDEVRLVPDRDNPYDSDAVAVFAPGGQIGFVNAKSPSRWKILDLLDDAIRPEAIVCQVKGEGELYGVVLLVRL